MSIVNNLHKLKEQLPSHVKLIAVSRPNPLKVSWSCIMQGIRFSVKTAYRKLPANSLCSPKILNGILSGTCKQNKVKNIAPFVSLIHSIDDLKLLIEVNKEAMKKNKTIDCLFEMYIATEESKFGLNYEEMMNILNSPEYKELHNIRICGLMGMATFTENIELVRKEFKHLKTIFDKIKTCYFSGKPYFKEYPWACPVIMLLL